MLPCQITWYAIPITLTAEDKMNISSWLRSGLVVVLMLAPILLVDLARAADNISGQVLGGGAPIANSTVTLWEASANAPEKLAEGKTNQEGRFDLRSAE